MTTQVELYSSTLKFRTLFLGFLCLLPSACGSFSSSQGITSNVLVLVTDVQGNPVPGATVWIPADNPQMRTDDDGALALVDEQGNLCADPPVAAVFAACTGTDGIALLPCGNQGTYLVNFSSGSQSGVINAKCGQSGVVPAPLEP